MRKGFTFVELAIVLVIIGIVMAMSMKGFGVLDSARVRNEVNKLNKFQVSVVTEVQKIGSIATARDLPNDDDCIGPDNITFSKVKDDVFLASGAITEKDFSTQGAPGERKEVRAYRMPYPTTDSTSCPGTTDFETARPGATLKVIASPYMVCSFESILDDQYADAGQGIIPYANFKSDKNVSISGQQDLRLLDSDGSIDFSCLSSGWPKDFDNSTTVAVYYYYLL